MNLVLVTRCLILIYLFFNYLLYKVLNNVYSKGKLADSKLINLIN